LRPLGAVCLRPWTALHLRGVIAAIALLCLTGMPTPAFAAELEHLEIVGKGGVHVFAVELALNDEQRARGLMHRRELPEGQGMLFIFDRDQEISMWMQNTYISLDMIFVRRDGTIARIAENTEPLSTRVIPSNGPVRAVLEVIGGTARKLGIEPGDRVAHRLFANR
jgi:uncharacterized membrane protein (UPF0127 family)